MISLPFVDILLEEVSDLDQELKILDSSLEIRPSEELTPPDYISSGRGGFTVRGNSCVVGSSSLVCNGELLDTSNGMVVFRSDGTVEVQSFLTLVAK